MTMKWFERSLWLLLTVVLLWSSLGKSYHLGYYKELYERARVCNKGFQLYLYYNHGIKINLDRYYEDAVKWVDDPQYQVDGIN